jgi:hypothetical protein
MNATVNPLDALHDARVAANSKLTALRGQMTKLNAIADAQKSAQAELDALSASELVAMQEWLAAGSAGAMPQPNMARRAELNQQVAAAMQQSATVSTVAADVSAQIDAANNEVAGLAAQIDDAALDAVCKQFEAALADLNSTALAAQAKAATVYGAIAFLHGEATRSQTAGDATRAMAIFKRLERLSALPKPTMQPTIGAVAAEAPGWRTMFEGLLQ